VCILCTPSLTKNNAKTYLKPRDAKPMIVRPITPVTIAMPANVLASKRQEEVAAAVSNDKIFFVIAALSSLSLGGLLSGTVATEQLSDDSEESTDEAGDTIDEEGGKLPSARLRTRVVSGDTAK
jgi:hypothetical protein